MMPPPGHRVALTFELRTRDGKEPSLLGFSSVRVLQKNWGSVRYEFFASTKTVGSVLFASICVRKTFDSFKSTDYTTRKL